MSVEVVVPEDFMGVIIGDLNSRRGRIEGMEHRAGSQVIKAVRAALRNVRLCDADAFVDPGTCDVLDALRALRRSAAFGVGRNHRPRSGQSSRQIKIRIQV